MRSIPSLLMIVLVAALTLASIIASGDKALALEHFRKGMALYNLDRYDAAIETFQAGYQEEPAPVFLFNIGQSHRLAKRLSQATDYYRKYLRIKPDASNRADVARLSWTSNGRWASLSLRFRRDRILCHLFPRPRPVPPAALPGGPPEPEMAALRRTWPIWVGVLSGVVMIGAAAGLGARAATRSNTPHCR